MNAAEYEAYVDRVVRELAEPTPEQIRKLQILFQYEEPQPHRLNHKGSSR